MDGAEPKDGLRAYLGELVAEYGEPTDDDYAWADEQLRRADAHAEAAS